METIVRAVAENEWLIFIGALVEVVTEFVMDRPEIFVGRLDTHLDPKVFDVVDIPCAGVANDFAVARSHEERSLPKRSRQRGETQRCVKPLADLHDILRRRVS